jgi:hypothetical protein
MVPDMTNPRPTTAEFILLAFVLFHIVAFIWGGGSWSSPSGPYEEYYRNPGVHTILNAAFAVDTTIATTILLWALFSSRQSVFLSVLLALVVVGALLTWTELWYGSTFSYGEVRDKQGLPFDVNNGGAFGSFVFLTYLVYRIPVPKRFQTTRRLCLPIAVGLVVLLHLLFWRAVYGPWKLWQS